MDRRSFLTAAASTSAAVAVGVGTPIAIANAPEGFHRVSMDKADDVGYRAWCMLNGDDLVARVYLNGAEVKWCRAADAREGWVRRSVETPGGNMAYDIAKGEILEETVHGDVRIEIVPRASKPSSLYRSYTPKPGGGEIEIPKIA